MAKVPAILKAFVLTGGAALLVGIAVLAAAIMLRAGERGRQETSGHDASAATAAPVDLALPAGARIEQVVADGRRLVLLAEDQDGRQYLAVVDALSGERQSLIRINPAE